MTQVFEVKLLFSAEMRQSRMQISGPIGSGFGANQQIEFSLHSIIRELDAIRESLDPEEDVEAGRAQA